jgi:hypothetical protein
MGDSQPDMQAVLDAHPEFAQKVTQFMTLRDAAEILDAWQPPHYGTAAAYLREVASTVMRQAGIGEDFLQAMIANMPLPA